MSVYTPVSEAQLEAWLGRYTVGALVALEPIARGVENSNFFVTTTQGRFVLTLLERLSAEALPYYVGLMAHLARHGIPCPAPIADRADALLSTLNGKPAVLVTRLPGASIDAPGVAECAALGGLLARMHLAAQSYAPRLENPRGPAWWRGAAESVRPHLDAPARALLDDALAFHAGMRLPALPSGAVHADLFRDNALFEEGRICGVVDFYFAGSDCLLYDCAVCVNDWCLVDPARDRALDPARTRALLAAYAAVRPFEAAEREAWPVMLRAAALRFWLSRLVDRHLPRPGALVLAHDPDHFRDILARRAVDRAPAWLD